MSMLIHAITGFIGIYGFYWDILRSKYEKKWVLLGCLSIIIHRKITKILMTSMLITGYIAYQVHLISV